ncbi:MAG: cupin domain-containing protein [Litorimonas sp.]
MPKININDHLEGADIAVPVFVKDLSQGAMKVVILDGDYPFHSHDTSDETFIILEGELNMDREGLPSLSLTAGDVVTIPKGVKHRTRTQSISKVILLGPN